ncbi:hypothetical protein OO17_27080, partial [Rhodopseudomonas palustris]
NDQLLPIRILENNKAIMKIKGDSKLSDAEKAAQIEPLQAEIKQFQDAADKAEHGAFKQQVDAFVAADKAGDQAKLKTLIAEFAANVASTPSN